MWWKVLLAIWPLMMLSACFGFTIVAILHGAKPDLVRNEPASEDRDCELPERVNDFETVQLGI